MTSFYPQVYSQFLDLDIDQNGMLSQQELLGYSGFAFGKRRTVNLTPVAVDRIFEEAIAYRPGM